MTPTPGWTPGDVATIVLWVCAAISTVAGASTVVVNTVKAAKKPEKTQNERIAKLEQRMDDAEKHLDNDKRRFEFQETEAAITRRSLLALLGHAITGDNETQLQKAYDDLNLFITGGKTNEHSD